MLTCMLCGLLFPGSAVADQAEVTKYLKEGGIFRIKNRGSSRYMTENANHGLVGQVKASNQAAALSQVWVVTGGATITIRNAKTGRFVPAENGNPMTTVSGSRDLYAKYSAANTGTRTSYITLSWHAKFEGDRCLNENAGSRNILGWKANGNGVSDNFSDWVFEPVTDITQDEIKASINAGSGAAQAEDGKYYRIVNTAYETYITEAAHAHTLNCLQGFDNDYSQVWKLEKKGNTWLLKNALTGYYIQRRNGTLSQQYKTVANTTLGFMLNEGADEYIDDYVIVDNLSNAVGLHCDQRSVVVGWYTTNNASQWKLEAVNVDEAALAKAQQELAEYAVLTTANAAKISKTLQDYFEDYACTRLKAEYQNMSDTELEALMSTTPSETSKIALPPFIQRMVLKVKNNSWGTWEKEFRNFAYSPYNNQEVAWRIGCGFLYSNQSNPTGIHVKRGDILTIYVDEAPMPGAELKLMHCVGLNVNGETMTLQRGFNYYAPSQDGSIFINYHVTNMGLSVSNFPDIRVHIEGGYVNGLFDTSRGHTNDDWLSMVNAGLFTDWVIHMKSKYFEFNLHKDQVFSVLRGTQYQSKFGYPSMNTDMKTKAVDKDGQPKGIQGALIRWDQIQEMMYELMDVTQFKGRYRGLTSASSSSGGNPYASSFGTYYPGVGGIIDYYDLTVGRDTDEGGNRWMVAHEVGHIHQALFNQPGDTEVSNNFFSQVSAWIGGSHVGRGRPWSKTAAAFHEGKFYHEYDLWQRSRMYFQLYLYFHVQGHDPQFYPKFFNLFRKQGMRSSGDASNPMSGRASFLRFAEYACEASGLDLSEFFRFYGYFKPLKNYTVGDYGNSYVTTTQAEINASIAKMQQYPKGPAGLMFIDERIRKEAAPKDAPSFLGTFRWATSGDAQPGSAAVGTVGMYSDFRDDIETAPYSCTVSSTGRVVVKNDGKGAVGFKVYNNEGILVYAANTYTFDIPTAIRQAGYTIYVAYGNGNQQAIHNGSGITAIDAANLDTPANTQADQIYQLDGRRGNTATKGVRIVNRKVVLH